MRVLFVSAEVAPFAKVGGLADVVGSLPSALREQGVDARVIMPGYGLISHHAYDISHLFTFQFTHRKGTSDVQVYSCVYDGVPIYFIQAFPYFGQEHTVYTDWNWDVPRFIFFNQVVMATAWELHGRFGWFPEVFNVSDWHTSLLPFLLVDSHHKPEWSSIASVVTIHNIAYQGSNVGGFLWDGGIPGRHHSLLDRYHLHDNLLAIAIAYSDMICTVSPTYAREIQYPYAGYELASIISDRSDDLVGILNGIDVTRYDPQTDPHIAATYDVSNFVEGRSENKRRLQEIAHLPIREDVPVIGIVSRLTWQKGFDLAIPALDRLLNDADVQVIALGTGEHDIEQAFRYLSDQYKWKATAFIQFDAALAQQIYAGSDLFLMPSHFEPCGIGQMIAMRYGTLPVVRQTGGLADTVINYDGADADQGTGFVFEWETADAVYGTLTWALDTYHRQPQAWQRMQRRAMQTDLSWKRSAKWYIDVFERAIEKRKDMMRCE